MDLPRQIALDILISWDRDGSFPNLLLKEKLSKVSDVRERAFCTNLVYGTIENKRRLDYWIAGVSSTPFKKIHIVNRNALRLGLYQIAYMNVPISAACNTAVDLVKKNGQMRSAGFVNAVLRKLSKVENRLSMPNNEDDESLGIRYSVDTSIIKLLRKECGLSFVREYFDALEQLPKDVTTLAINPLKTDADMLSEALEKQGIEVVGRTEDLLTVRFSLNIALIQAYQDGWFHVIGKPSYDTAMQLDVKPGQTVFDLCSAPGGKTFLLAYKMKNTGKIIACDVHPHKVDLLQKEADRLGLTNIEVVCLDATVFKKTWQGSADRVLCDAPCSGLGIIGKKPDIRYKNMAEFSLCETQHMILKNGMEYLKPEGQLVYSTCTVNPAENQGIVKDFEQNILKNKTYLPQKDKTEGFYYAVLSANK